MKILFTTILSFTLVVLSSFTNQNTIDGVIGALKAGNANELSRYFDDNLQLKMPDKSDTYSKAQAQLIVKDFFNNNKVKTFELKHKGEQNGDEYCVGTLSTALGSFRTTVFAKNRGGKQMVIEVRIQTNE